MKIGFFGGCFNPPTIAHIELAKKAIDECELDKLIFVPVGDFYEKRELIPAIHRYNMLKIAINNIDKMEVSDIELKLKEKSYAIDIFKIIKHQYANDDVYFIMGADNYININNWKDGKELIKNFKYIIFERENIDIEDYIERNMSKYRDRLIIVKNQEYKKISSSEFRKKISNREYFDTNFVNKEILEYIEKNKLFIANMNQ